MFNQNVWSGHCTFDSGLCKFSNDPAANFDWKVVSNEQWHDGIMTDMTEYFAHRKYFHQGRGSNNPNTGPQRDHASFATNRVTGAFAYIDARHPRRPGQSSFEKILILNIIEY